MLNGAHTGMAVLNSGAAFCVDDAADIRIDDRLIRQVGALNAITVVYRSRLKG